MNDYGHFCRPNLMNFLGAIGLDAQYERAQGDSLWQRRGERLEEVLDFVGGYGATLFGHNHPELVAEVRQALADGAPILAQGSNRMAAGRLARALSQRLGDYMVVFANSGAETIEAALEHAYLERQKPTFWAIKGGFHGKTLGSVQLTWSYAAPFAGLGPDVHYVDPDDPASWQEAERSAGDVSAVFVEPIRGEGGVRPLPRDFAAWLVETTKRAGIPVVADEIQSGMGRTGTFLASQAMGIEPDYICLSKALGGGLVKIGALLIRRERFVEHFSIIHTSTFAEDELSCRVALKALQILDRDALPQRCAAAGEHALSRLRALQARFPDQVKEVRGAGLMLGVEFHNQSSSPSNVLMMLSRQKYLGYVAAAYLLNVHNIRIAPTLSDPFTLRLEPSAYISNAAIDRCVDALYAFCRLLEARDTAPLIRQQLGKPQRPVRDYRGARCSTREKPRTNARVAFIGNLILPEHAALLDPALADFSPEEMESYLSQTAHLLGPCIYDQINVRSQTGDEVHLSFVGLSLTARQIMESVRRGESKWVLEKIRQAVGLAVEEGCTVVGLGGHTSIASSNGLRLRGCKIALTSGNSLTVAMVVKCVERASRKMRIPLAQSSLAVVGASGNIGSTCALMLGPEFAAVYLVARCANSPALVALGEKIRDLAPNTEVQLTDSLDVLRRCSVVVSASNSPSTLIFPEHVAPAPVVICDIAVPGDLDDEVGRVRPDIEVVRGALVRVPDNRDFRISGIPLSEGYVFPCMAETLLMGLENMRTNGFCGAITASGVHQMCTLAEKHGFRLAG